MSAGLTYLDNNATTRIDPRVLATLQSALEDEYANPSSVHRFGTRVAALVENARAHVAGLIGARESEVLFTSGGTESNNTALRGVLAARPEKRHVVISTVEHSSILEPVEQLEREGIEVTRVGVDRDGRLSLDQLYAALREDTALVSIMLANNETGVILPLTEVCRIAGQRSVPVHTDAVNAAGKLPIDVRTLGVSLMSLSAHKMYGPKGVGALYVQRGTPFRPLLYGGPHERNRRGGTLNAPGIIGFGKAAELLREDLPADSERIRRLRDLLETALAERFPQVVIAGQRAERIVNTTCACFPDTSAEALLLLFSEEDICVSSGSACSSGSLEPSHVLQAMGLDPAIAQGQIRISLGRFTMPADIDRLLEFLPEALHRVAGVSIR